MAVQDQPGTSPGPSPLHHRMGVSMTALVVVASALGAYLVGGLVRFAVNALDRTLATEDIWVYSDSADLRYRDAIMAIEAEVALHGPACRRQRPSALWW